MSVAPLRPCSHPSCPALVRAGRCRAHAVAVQPWQHRVPVSRVRGRKLQQLRAQLFRAEPLCRLCAAAGYVVPATIRDHIVPIAEGGTDDLDNIAPLCRACSDRKTADESRRGRRAQGSPGGSL